jgi:hypothetical protein
MTMSDYNSGMLPEPSNCDPQMTLTHDAGLSEIYYILDSNQLTSDPNPSIVINSASQPYSFAFTGLDTDYEPGVAGQTMVEISYTYDFNVKVLQSNI